MLTGKQIKFLMEWAYADLHHGTVTIEEWAEIDGKEDIYKSLPSELESYNQIASTMPWNEIEAIRGEIKLGYKILKETNMQSGSAMYLAVPDDEDDSYAKILLRIVANSYDEEDVSAFLGWTIEETNLAWEMDDQEIEMQLDAYDFTETIEQAGYGFAYPYDGNGFVFDMYGTDVLVDEDGRAYVDAPMGVEASKEVKADSSYAEEQGYTKEHLTDKKCPRCDALVYNEIRNDIDYPYYCAECDENMYAFEVEAKQVKAEDYDFNQNVSAWKFILEGLGGATYSGENYGKSPLGSYIEKQHYDFGEAYIQIFHRLRDRKPVVQIDKYYDSERLQEEFGEYDIVELNVENPQETLDKVKSLLDKFTLEKTSKQVKADSSSIPIGIKDLQVINAVADMVADQITAKLVKEAKYLYDERYADNDEVNELEVFRLLSRAVYSAIPRGNSLEIPTTVTPITEASKQTESATGFEHYEEIEKLVRDQYGLDATVQTMIMGDHVIVKDDKTREVYIEGTQAEVLEFLKG